MRSSSTKADAGMGSEIISSLTYRGAAEDAVDDNNDDVVSGESGMLLGLFWVWSKVGC